MQGPYPASLSSLLQSTGTALKRQAILQQLTLKLTPIMEKAMVDAVVVHRCSPPCRGGLGGALETGRECANFCRWQPCPPLQSGSGPAASLLGSAGMLPFH